MVICSFRCVCEAFYLVLPARQQFIRINEYYPNWVCRGYTGSINDAILVHLIGAEYIVDMDKVIRVVYRGPLNKSHSATHSTDCWRYRDPEANLLPPTPRSEHFNCHSPQDRICPSFSQLQAEWTNRMPIAIWLMNLHLWLVLFRLRCMICFHIFPKASCT